MKWLCRWALPTAVACWLLAAPLVLAAPDAGAPGKVSASCSEYLPKGAVKPQIESKLPARGLSGYATWLEVVVTHGPGETVMPEGFRARRGSDAFVALKAMGWVIPEPDGGVGPLIEALAGDKKGGTVETRISIPFVALPKGPGRNLMVLPPVPISVARANGQVMTLCTQGHSIIIEDPIADEPDPQVKPNPAPRPQPETWQAAVNAAIAAAIIVPLALLLALLFNWQRKRPKPAPPKPRVLPWVVAMQELDEIRASGLIEEGKLDEYFDRVDHCTRLYIGERYGFDGLESTSEEIRVNIKRVYPPIKKSELLNQFLQDTDFVKYAEVTPLRDDCGDVMKRAVEIIRGTMPPTQDRRAADRSTA